jgi:hypothetical protein
MRSTLVAVGVNAREQVTATTIRVRRVAAGPALLRLTAALAALVALITALPLDQVLAAPLSVPLRIGGAAVAVSVAVGVLPRTRWVSLVALGVIALWLIATIGFGVTASVARVGLLAAALYLMHAAAAFAAALPYDCVIAPEVLLRWVRRVTSVLGLSLLTGLGLMGLAGKLPAARSVVGPIVGSIAAAGLAGLLAWHLLRRRG